MKHKASDKLVELMSLSSGRDFTIFEIYKIVRQPPHRADITATEAYTSCSRYIAEAREGLRRLGFVLAKGDLRNSYRACKRKR